MRQPLVHVALPAELADARSAGRYPWSTRGRTVDDEGFVHLAHLHQLDGVVERFYADVDELAILVVDPDRLDAPVIEESPAPGAAERFPHLYGELPLDGVVAVVQWRPSDGVSPGAAVAASLGG